MTSRMTRISLGGLCCLLAVSAWADDPVPELAPPPPAEGDVLSPPQEESPPQPVPQAAPAPVATETPQVTAAPAPQPVIADVPVIQKSDTEMRMEKGSDFQLLRPMWATEFTFSPGSLGRTNLDGSQNSSTPKAFSFSAQYQPTGIQKIGVVSIGPTVSMYPFLPSNSNITYSTFSLWSVGVAARYQARFAREQLIVPVAGLNVEHFVYHTKTNGSGSFPLAGPMVGLNLLLNPLEPSSAFDFYTNTGVLRSYLTAEALILKGSDNNFDISGTSAFFGIRVEF